MYYHPSTAVPYLVSDLAPGQDPSDTKAPLLVSAGRELQQKPVTKSQGFSGTWNAMNQATRKRLLAQAGISKVYAARVFDYLPSWVRVDIEYTHRLKGA